MLLVLVFPYCHLYNLITSFKIVVALGYTSKNIFCKEFFFFIYKQYYVSARIEPRSSNAWIDTFNHFELQASYLFEKIQSGCWICLDIFLLYKLWLEQLILKICETGQASAASCVTETKTHLQWSGWLEQ